MIVVVAIDTDSNTSAEVSTHPFHTRVKQVGYRSIKMHEVNKTIR